VEWLSYQEDKDKQHKRQDKKQSKETRLCTIVLQAGVQFVHFSGVYILKDHSLGYVPTQ
jgi:hypothetical protein